MIKNKLIHNKNINIYIYRKFLKKKKNNNNPINIRYIYKIL